MKKLVWTSKDSEMKSFVLDVPCNNSTDVMNRLIMTMECFVKEHPYKLLLDVSEVSLSRPAMQATMEADDTFVYDESSEYSKQLQYSYLWCKLMKDQGLPSVDYYCDVTHVELGDVDAGQAAALLSLIHTEHLESCLKSIEAFAKVYVRRVIGHEDLHKQLLEVQRR